MRTPRTTRAMALLLMGSSFGLASPTLEGKVVGHDGSGKPGVTVTLAGSGLSTRTGSDGAWQIGGNLRVQTKQETSQLNTGRLLLQAGHLSTDIEGHDPSGRRIHGAESRSSVPPLTAHRTMATPDTLVYSIGSQVFLRDTISMLAKTGIVRLFDTTVNASMIHGYLQDPRDGQTYRTVGIGTQVWMAQNLNLVVDSSWIPSGDADSGARYGRLYNWPTIMGLAPSLVGTHSNGTEQRVRGLCPEGWRIPSRAEWAVLDTFVSLPSTIPLSGRFMRSKDGWFMGMIRSALTDQVGFKGMPAGHRDTSGTFRSFHYQAGWWSASDTSETKAWVRANAADYISGGGTYRLWETAYDKREGFSLRCIKD